MHNKSSLIVNRKRWYNQRKWRVGLFVLVLLAIFATLELTGVTHFIRDPKPEPGVIKSESNDSQPQTTSTPDKTDDAVANSSPSTSSNPQQKDTSVSTDSVLQAPFGNFVSNHHPVSSDPASTKQQSVCITTPGATCVIKFTQGSVTRELAEQTTDSNGYTTWNWDIKSSGLTQGSWEITATAKLNGQEISSKDALNLEVQ